jgi:hypothetical protein
MFQSFKRHFIPHAGNDHQPHFLRWESTLAVLAVVLFIQSAFFIQTLVIFPTHFFGLILPDALIDLTNANRTAEAAPVLAEDGVLDAAARAKAEDMAAKGYFAHYAPDGTSPWHWFQTFGYAYTYAGENLAINFTDSKDVVDAWMASPKHRENIVNTHYTEIGIGTANGVYQGREAVFVVQFFGAPAAVTAPVIATTGTPAIAVTAPAPKPTIAPKPAVKPAPVTLVEENTFVAVRGEEAAEPSLSPTSAPAEVSVAGSTVSSHTSVVASILASPRAAVNFIYLVLATIIAATLVLLLLVRTHRTHPRLLVNATLMLMMIAGALAANHWIALASATVR